MILKTITHTVNTGSEEIFLDRGQKKQNKTKPNRFKNPHDLGTRLIKLCQSWATDRERERVGFVRTSGGYCHEFYIYISVRLCENNCLDLGC